MTEQLDTGNVSESQGLSSEAVQAESAPAPKESYISQADVNKTLGVEKQKAYERGKREALAELEKMRPQASESNYGPNAQGQPTSSYSAQENYQEPKQNAGVQSYTPEQIQKMVDEGIQKNAREHAFQSFINDFDAKLANGQKDYEDFDTVVQPVLEDLVKSNGIDFLNHVHGVDNTADVMYELGKNTKALAELSWLASKFPSKAAAEIKALSTRLKENKTASKNPPVPPPISQIRPSNAGTDNGKLSSDWNTSDWREYYRNKR